MAESELIKVFDDYSVRSLWDDVNRLQCIYLLNGATFPCPSTPLRVLLSSSSLSGVEGCGEHVNTFGRVNPTIYWRKLKQRLKKEGNQSVTNCHALVMKILRDSELNPNWGTIYPLVGILKAYK